MHQLSNVAAALAHPAKPPSRNRTERRITLVQPGVDSGIAPDRTVETQQSGYHAALFAGRKAQVGVNRERLFVPHGAAESHAHCHADTNSNADTDSNFIHRNTDRDTDTRASGNAPDNRRAAVLAPEA
jgi:hypothetical protein